MGRLRTGRGIVLLAAGLGAVWSAALAQAPVASPAPAKCPGSSATEQKPCPAAPSTAQQFPYPGEQPDSPTPPDAPAPANGRAAAPASPNAPAPASSTPPSTGQQQFPYPGEDPESGSASSGSSSSSSSSGSSSTGADPAAAPADASKSPLKDAGSEGENTRRHKLPKVTKLQSDEDREAEDLDVAKYYLSAGSPMAAYLRSKDAVKLKPSDPEAHFSLAEAAAKLKKRDEAVAEFQQYLQMEPDGEHVKAVRKLLADLK